MCDFGNPNCQTMRTDAQLLELISVRVKKLYKFFDSLKKELYLKCSLFHFQDESSKKTLYKKQSHFVLLDIS